MKQILSRPAARFDAGDGLLRNEHFQVAYATNDIERACAIFSNRFGLRKYERLEGELPGGGYIRVALGWVGGTMFELIQAEGQAGEFYNGRLLSKEFAIHHHHLGYFIQDEAAWEALKGEIRRGGWTIACKNTVEGMLQAWYIDVPELSHYLEFIFPEPAGKAFLENVPSN